MIDVLSKFVVVIPLKERKAKHITPPSLKAFNMIGKQPEIPYTDDEGALTDKCMAAEFEGAGIEHIVTSGSVHFVERFNRTFRTFKFMVSPRMKVLNREFRLTTKQPPVDTPQ